MKGEGRGEGEGRERAREGRSPNSYSWLRRCADVL